MGIGAKFTAKLHRSLRNTLRKLALAFVFFYIELLSISAGNRRERLKVVKAMNVHEYTKSFSTFDRSRLLPALIESTI